MSVVELIRVTSAANRVTSLPRVAAARRGDVFRSVTSSVSLMERMLGFFFWYFWTSLVSLSPPSRQDDLTDASLAWWTADWTFGQTWRPRCHRSVTKPRRRDTCTQTHTFTAGLTRLLTSCYHQTQQLHLFVHPKLLQYLLLSDCLCFNFIAVFGSFLTDVSKYKSFFILHAFTRHAATDECLRVDSLALIKVNI